MHRFKIVKNAFSFSCLIGLAVLLLSSAEAGNPKRWDPNDKLRWTDFRDTAIDNSDRAALTNAGIRLSFNQIDQSTVSVDVYSIMDRSKSWVDRNKKSDYILSHEQYHFNITEYWCRKLKSDIAAQKYTAKNLKEKISAIRKEDFSLMNEMQTEYDHDTKHSEIESEQKKWEKKIDHLLKTVEEYSAESITVKLK